MKIILKIGTIVLVLVVLIGGILYALAGSYSKASYCYEQSGNMYLLNITAEEEYTITKVSKGNAQFVEIETGKYTKTDSSYVFTSKDDKVFSGELKNQNIVINGTIDNFEFFSASFSKPESTMNFMKELFTVYQGD